MTGEFESSIPAPKKNQILIGELFSAVHKPIIAKVDGDVYAEDFSFGWKYLCSSSPRN